jgi:hypothetical protein
LNEKIQHPAVLWLYNTATQIRNDLSRFYRDTDKDRIRFNFGETPFAYTFKIKFTPSHRVLKFIVPKDPDITTVECQLFEKTNNIIRDIDQLYAMKEQYYLPLQLTSANRSELLEIWYWGCFVRVDRKNDIYKVQSHWLTSEPRCEDVLYIALITKVKCIGKSPEGIVINTANPSLQHIVFDPVVKLQLELVTPMGTQTLCVDVQAGLENGIYPGQIYIVNWMNRFSIMRFTPAKHHLSFTPEQYLFIVDYLSKEVRDGYKERKESQNRCTAT